VHPEGYLSYRIAESWNDGFAEHRCAIVDYAPATAGAHAALWQVMLGMDLVASIESQELPPDDPLPFLLNNPRALRTVSLRDGVWLRPLDLTALLSARSYSVPIDTVLQLRDPLLGDQRVQLSGGPDGASCERTDRPAEVEFSPSGLGSAYLGGHRLQTLARAGQVRCDDAALLARLQAAFLCDREPRHGTGF
jgi:predicted acetyltransferase